jgi:hypothetical protein
MEKKTIVQQHKKNFETLQEAFRRKQICLMECTLKSTGEKLAVICTIVFDGNEYIITPFASLFNGNPYDLLTPPM